jgi:hypothetical protein
MFKEIKIERFGLHDETAIAFDDAPVSLFVGANEHGKSTIRQAARFLLDGNIVDEELQTLIKKQLHHVFIRDGKAGSNLTVSGTVDVNGKAYALNRKQTKSAATGSPALDIDRDVLNCLFNTKHYPRMTTRDRAKLWFRVLGLQLDMEGLKKQIKKRVPGSSVLDPTDLGTIWLTYEKSGFDRAEGAAVEMRRQFKRDMEALPKEPPAATCQIEFVKDGEAEVKEIKFSDHTMEGVEAAIASEIRKVDEAIEARWKLEGRQAESSEHIRSALDNAAQNIERLEVEIKDLKKGSPELDVLAEKQKAALESWEAIREEIKELETEIQAIEALPDWSEDCPLYADVKCKSKTPIEKLLKDKRKAVGGLRRSRTAKQRNHDNLKADVEALTMEKNQAGENARIFIEKTQRLEYYRAEVARLEKLKKKAKPFGKNDRQKLRDFANDIGNGRGRIRAFEKLMDHLIIHEAATIKFEKATDAESDLQGKINAADEIAVALGSGPKGIRATMTKKARSTVNAILSAFDDLLGRSVVLDDNLSIKLGDVSYEEQLSHSARRRLGIAVQAAIAELTGLKFIAIDDLENLDPKQRNVVLKIGRWLGNDFDFQVWLFSSLGPREVDLIVDALPIPWLAAYHVANGKVEKLEKGQNA